MEIASAPGAGPPPDLESASEPGARPQSPSASESGARPQSPSTRPRRNWFVYLGFASQIGWVISVLVLGIVLWRTVCEQMLFIVGVGVALGCLIGRFVMISYQSWTSQRMRHKSIEQRFPAFGASAREGSEDLCAICLEEKIDSQLLRKMACNHDFHMQCFDEWLLHSHNQKSEGVCCPLCRTRELL
mmetsp:Transcript_134400/g.429397  ORF Transcript_134400/g.429397 Transcript_134400/m.429397 type:complete len:187 (+) Transcript_134400:65-625(+)